MTYTLCITFQIHHFTVQKTFSDVFKYAPNLRKQCIGYMLTTNYLYIESRYKELSTCFNQPKGGKHMFPIFENEFLSFSETIKVGVCVFVLTSILGETV